MPNLYMFPVCALLIQGFHFIHELMHMIEYELRRSKIKTRLVILKLEYIIAVKSKYTGVYHNPFSLIWPFHFIFELMFSDAMQYKPDANKGYLEASFCATRNDVILRLIHFIVQNL